MLPWIYKITMINNFILFSVLVIAYTKCSETTEEKRALTTSQAPGSRCVKIKCPAIENPACLKLTYKDGPLANHTMYIITANRCEMQDLNCVNNVNVIAVEFPMKYCDHRHTIMKSKRLRKTGMKPMKFKKKDLQARVKREMNIDVVNKEKMDKYLNLKLRNEDKEEAESGRSAIGGGGKVGDGGQVGGTGQNGPPPGVHFGDDDTEVSDMSYSDVLGATGVEDNPFSKEDALLENNLLANQAEGGAAIGSGRGSGQNGDGGQNGGGQFGDDGDDNTPIDATLMEHTRVKRGMHVKARGSGKKKALTKLSLDQKLAPSSVEVNQDSNSGNTELSGDDDQKEPEKIEVVMPPTITPDSENHSNSQVAKKLSLGKVLSTSSESSDEKRILVEDANTDGKDKKKKKKCVKWATDSGSKEKLNVISGEDIDHSYVKDEYNADCPKTCPARHVPVCARCADYIYRTFLSVCHMRMFQCKHPDEKLQLVSRQSCVLSAPYHNDGQPPQGTVGEPNDDDPVLRYIWCKERDVRNIKGTITYHPRCKEAASKQRNRKDKMALWSFYSYDYMLIPD